MIARSFILPCMLAVVAWFAAGFVLTWRQHARTFPRLPFWLGTCHLIVTALLALLLLHSWRCCDWVQ